MLVLLVLLDVKHLAVAGVDLDVLLTGSGFDRYAVDEISILVLELNGRGRARYAGERCTTRLIGSDARQLLILSSLGLFLRRSGFVGFVGFVGFCGLVAFGLLTFLVA